MKQNMNLPDLVIYTFLLQSTVAEDDDGYPKLSIKPITTSSTKTGETTVEGKQAPWGRARLRSNSRVHNKDNMFLKWVRWSGSQIGRASCRERV